MTENDGCRIQNKKNGKILAKMEFTKNYERPEVSFFANRSN